MEYPCCNDTFPTLPHQLTCHQFQISVNIHYEKTTEGKTEFDKKTGVTYNTRQVPEM